MPFEQDIDKRVELIKSKKKELVGVRGSLVEFANGYLYFGFHRTDGGWVYREWAPAADALYLTGDFNCDPGSPPYAAATERLLDARRTARIDLSTEKRTFHAYKETGGGEIDFIFHNNKTIPLKYEVISKDYDGFVSDHYGVIAEFING